MDTNNEYGTLQLQQELLGLLKEFHQFCVSNGIKYSLAYGSLLGAIRHNGFIPWDDDVDIIMTRNEFDRLKSVINNNPLFKFNYLSKSALWVGRIKSKNPSCVTVIPSVLDIFIIDNVPDNGFVSRIKLLIILLLMGMMKNKPDLSRFKPIMKICSYLSWLLGKLIPLKITCSLFESVCKWGNKKQSMRVSCYNTAFAYMGKTFSSQMMNSFSFHPFEDTNLYIMDGYDEFLSKNYGDYMTPPKDKVGHHIHPEFKLQYK